MKHLMLTLTLTTGILDIFAMAETALYVQYPRFPLFCASPHEKYSIGHLTLLLALECENGLFLSNQATIALSWWHNM